MHQGLLAEADPLPSPDIETLTQEGIVLVLDQITDPHNVGAILRSAAAFAVKAIVTTARHSPEATGVLAKAASGALELVPMVTVQNLADYDFSGVDIAFFSAGGSVSREHAPRAAEAGAVVIDNTSEFRYQDDIPLVVSEVNPHAIAQYTNRGIIANPNCSTMQMLVALGPIHHAVGIERINVATYQSVSGAGRSGPAPLPERL